MANRIARRLNDSAGSILTGQRIGVAIPESPRGWDADVGTTAQESVDLAALYCDFCGRDPSEVPAGNPWLDRVVSSQ